MEIALLPEQPEPVVTLFLLASSIVTSMITASLGAGGGVLLLLLMASWMLATAIIPVHGLGGPVQAVARQSQFAVGGGVDFGLRLLESESTHKPMH